MEKFKELLMLKSLKGIGKARIYSKYAHLLAQNYALDDLMDIVLSNENKLTEDDWKAAVAASETIINRTSEIPDCTVITVFDKEYPISLKSMGNKKPVFLFIRGNKDILFQRGIAVIGTREPSEWTRKCGYSMVKKILEITDDVIISGLALGCDEVAHDATVKNSGKTVAVLPSGINVITPPSHGKLAEDILTSGGCLVSEYLPDEKATRFSFTERDAIVAALASKIIVLECGVKSGTMHTVNDGIKMKRPIGCFMPKDLQLGSYEGNEHIIKELHGVTLKDTDDLTEFLK